MPLIFLFILFIFIFIIFLGKYLYSLRKRGKLQKYLPLKEAQYTFLDIEDHSNSEDHYKNFRIDAEKIKLSSIYLVHGTFVGDDPFHFFKLIETLFPKLSKKMMKTLKDNTKRAQNLFAKDLGNYIEEHVQTLQMITNHKVKIRNFHWSSGNHHFARIEGAINLIFDLAENCEKEKRILLIGHSHAGQLFSIITQLINDSHFKKNIFKVIERKFNLSELEQSIQKIKNLRFDFVTQGTPHRYQWKLNDKMKLMHFINHRGESLQGGDVFGILNTRDGDYIQQWGIAGSDIIPPVSEIQLINLELDQFLDIGSNIELLRTNIKHRNRLHNDGHHFLVNYRDNAKFPNFFRTIFGHGIYTKLKYFDFHLDTISNFLWK